MVSLNPIPKIHECTNSSDELRRGCAGDDANDVVLDIAMYTSSHLLELGYTVLEMAKTRGGLYNGESEVDF